MSEASFTLDFMKGSPMAEKRFHSEIRKTERKKRKKDTRNRDKERQPGLVKS